MVSKASSPNSHCSTVKFGLDNSTQHQPHNGHPAIGHETIDPPGFNFCANPYTYKCRYSDASAYGYAFGESWAGFGRIMRTTYPGYGMAGSLDIAQAAPYWEIWWKMDQSTDAPVGTEITKMGATSGWTFGYVQRTCVRITSNNAHLLCQWESNIWSEPGDSGSPIFQIVDQTEMRVALNGILWGGPTGVWSTSWHSPIRGIQQDFGKSLAVCLPGGC